ncbi:MAG: EamA family transporter [Nanoarchaeota archaeon]
MSFHLNSWLILTVLSAAILTIQRIFQKKVLIKEHATMYLTTFCFMMWIILLPFIPIYGIDADLNILLIIIFKSFILSISWLLIVKAYRHMELSAVEPLKNFSPFLLLILAFIFLKETPTIIQLVGVGFILFGGYILEGVIHPHGFKHINVLFRGKYIHYIFLSLIVGAFSGILDKIVLAKVSVLTMMFFEFLFASIFTFIYQSVKYKGYKDIIYSLKTNGLLIVLVAITTLISDWAYFRAVAIPDSLVSLVVPVRRLTSLFIVIIGGELFHEKSIIEKTLACLVMLVGVYFIAS